MLDASRGVSYNRGMQTNRPRSGQTTYHRDGSVTHWDIYRQQWMRQSHLSDEVLASMSASERARVLRHRERHQLDDLG